jgi:hypothetical protein
MYLIADDEHAVLETDVSHLGQLLTCPHPSSRVVRVAEQEYPHIGVGTLLFKVLPIHLITLVHHLERVLCEEAIVVSDTREEAVIDWGLYENLGGMRN